MKMFVIEDAKKEKLSKGLEKMLHIGGMLMQCVENMEESDEEGYGERDWDEMDDDMGYRDPDYRSRMGRRNYGGGRYGMRRGR